MKRLVWMVVACWLLAGAAMAGAPSAEGQWLGGIGGVESTLRIVFHITKGADGRYAATADSLDQGVKGIPVGDVTVTGEVLHIEMPVVGGSFEGTFNADHTEVKGTWRQSGQESPLTLARTEVIPAPKRPQTPVKPYPYREEEVSVENAAAKVRLAGTLTVPPGKGPFPAVVLVSGSGQQDRDGTVFGHQIFLVLADALTRRGLAVLRVDDRGVGASTGDPRPCTTQDFAGDARTEVAYLTTRPEVDRQRTGLFGISEGAVIAALVAADTPEVAFVVMSGGPGVKGEEVVLEQQRLIALAGGASAEALREAADTTRRCFAVVKAEKDDAAAAARLRAIMMEPVEKMSAEERKARGITKEAVETSLQAETRQMLSPWFRYFLTYDPAPALRTVHVPVLALWGEKDLQVPPAQNRKPVEEALREGGNERVTVKVLPGLNHLLQTCRTGSPTEYTRIEETLSPAALQTIGDWILKQTKRAR